MRVTAITRHLTDNRFNDGSAVENKKLFAGLADVGDQDVHSGLLYAAKRNRNPMNTFT